MRSFLQDEQGQDIVEYALVVAAVCLTLIATVSQLARAVSGVYSSIVETITGVGTPDFPRKI
jgi:Flp pilus assembly pilin Flp